MSKERTIKLVPNQKLIIVNKAKSNKENHYCILNLKSLDRACSLLQSKAGIKLYLYLAKNQHKFILSLSSADFIEWAGVSRTAYNTSISELIENGYLVLREGTKETYDFYENGIGKERETKTKSIKEQSDGFNF